MKEMKVIDLLNKIANGEEFPKKVKYEGDIFEYDGIDFQNYDDYEKASLIGDCIFYRKKELNDEVEIIEDTPKEDKKIEKFKVIKDNSGDSVRLVYDDMNLNLTLLQAIILDKVNEVIDKLNGEDNE